jgi:hypothetical protein
MSSNAAAAASRSSLLGVLQSFMSTVLSPTRPENLNQSTP